MITRRTMSVGALTALICAPAVVRAASLMPISAAALRPRGYGSVERMFIYMLTPHLSELLRAGMSPEGIAGELNRRAVGCVNGAPWDAWTTAGYIRAMKDVHADWCQRGRAIYSTLGRSGHRAPHWSL